MSDLRPKGTPIVLDGVERSFLFSLNVVEEVQDHLDCSLEEAIDRLTDKRESVRTLRYLATALLNDEAQRVKDGGYPTYTEQEVGWMITQENVVDVTMAVLKAYGLTLPKPDEYASPNAGGGQSG